MTTGSDYAPDADPPPPPPQVDTPASIVAIRVELSAELYTRAMQICQRRNCVLELVLNDLMDRYLPRAHVGEDVKTMASSRALPTSVTQALPWNRWKGRPRR